MKTFEAVARLGGMNRAAGELNTVQSNVTGRIRRLEDELGVELFERRSRGVVPTAAGERLLPYAHRALRLFEDARRAATDDGTPAGPLVVGSLETTAALRLAPLVGAFVAAYPDVDLTLRTGTTAEMIDAVVADRVEGAFVCGPVDHPQLVVEPVFREELVAVTVPGVASLDSALRAGDARIVVLRAGCSYRQRLEDILARRGTIGPRLLEFGTVEALIACTGAGLGITLLPRAIAEPCRAEGRVALHDLAPEESIAETVFVRRRDRRQSSALSAFLAASRAAPPALAAE